LTREPPYPHLNISEFAKNAMKEVHIATTYIPADTPPQVFELLEQCLSINPNNRPTFDEIAAELEKILAAL
jgi:hypothetical protein